jgi:hypothetical protein
MLTDADGCGRMQAALHDLRDSLTRTHQYAHLVTELRAAIQKRLLHAG